MTEVRQRTALIVDHDQSNQVSEKTHYDLIPDYFKDNQYIKRGYRLNFQTNSQIFKSLFLKHNEVINVWTHLIAAFSILSIILYFLTLGSFNDIFDKQIDLNLREILNQEGRVNQLQSVQIQESEYQKQLQIALISQIEGREPSISQGFLTFKIQASASRKLEFIHDYLPEWPIIIFLISALACLTLSSVFHLFCSKNDRCYKILLRLDYAGVTLLLSGSSFPPYLYGFYCKMHIGYTYIFLLTTFSLIVFILSLQDFFHSKKYFKTKNILYGCLGAYTFVPAIHLVLQEFYTNQDLYQTWPSLFYYFLMGGFYLLGLIIYASRCPERFKPGYFDICGASHQLWHCCIVASILFTFLGALNNFYMRKINKCVM